jgi:predicted anti-sigma-YlaC factor YlaD
MTCREVTDILDRYIDGDLPKRQRLFIRLHLMMCRNCRNYLRTYRQTIRAAKTLTSTPHDPPPQDMPEELVQAILASRAKAK